MHERTQKSLYPSNSNLPLQIFLFFFSWQSDKVWEAICLQEEDNHCSAVPNRVSLVTAEGESQVWVNYCRLSTHNMLASLLHSERKLFLNAILWLCFQASCNKIEEGKCFMFLLLKFWSFTVSHFRPHSAGPRRWLKFVDLPFKD